MWFYRVIRVCIVLVCLSLAACGGGGAGSDGRGLGTEGTGFKVLVRGVLVNSTGSGIAGADVHTDDAAATTNAQGEFTVSTTIDPGEAVQISVVSNTIDTTVALAPVNPGPNDELEVTMRADDNTGTVVVENQQLVPKGLDEVEIDQNSDDFVSEIESGNDQIVDDEDLSSVGQDSALDPDFVDL